MLVLSFPCLAFFFLCINVKEFIIYVPRVIIPITSQNKGILSDPPPKKETKQKKKTKGNFYSNGL